MLTGWRLLGGKYYYFSMLDDATMGQLLENTVTQDGYRVDQEGAWDGKDPEEGHVSKAD